MQMLLMTLKYLGFDCDVYAYDNGLCTYVGIDEAYAESNIRNKVIYRIDGMDALVGLYFKKETLTKYRSVIYKIITKQIEDPNKVSNALTELVKLDDIFRDALEDILYFHGNEEESFADSIFNAIGSKICEMVSTMVSLFRGTKNFVICESDGYIYFSVDVTSTDVTLPFETKPEVIGYEKNWKVNFEVLK